ncbi:hypothetical protein CKO44_07650 [Rubrivivax gelatinosus]|uniref:putative holin n=1 Tax=Rubrivivax gelatinosus TaxID=28068 RepID=UPI0019074BF6|nr:putative holin [Rubrivivax gelatinosus]MBK1613343.1 hypothetical protein [Rubrivivax gelatinosus]MBZ8143086.1 hypothetical protein [Rubrivivax gelatinosus]
MAVRSPRMTSWLILSVLLFVAALGMQHMAPSSLVAVTLYKLHLMSTAGWAGYWLDRVLFPYARPHLYCEAETEIEPFDDGAVLQVMTAHAPAVMLRRAVIVAGCLICVALGA